MGAEPINVLPEGLNADSISKADRITRQLQLFAEFRTEITQCSLQSALDKRETGTDALQSISPNS